MTYIESESQICIKLWLAVEFGLRLKIAELYLIDGQTSKDLLLANFNFDDEITKR